MYSDLAAHSMGVNLITGASGFIGGRLLNSQREEGQMCRCLSRNVLSEANSIVADLADHEALKVACQGVARVFHCAGFAHAFSASSEQVAAQHWKVNFEGTRNLVEAAGQVGVQKFVFLSSVKAMGEPGNDCVDEEFSREPETDYGRAKRAAESAVVEAGRKYGMHVVNLRLAMVYGPGGRGNLERMSRLIKRGLFPPLPNTGNRRSLVHVDDVVGAMRRVVDDPRANGRSYIVASRETPSGRELYDALRLAQGLPPISWSVPAFLLYSVAAAGDLLECVAGQRAPLNSEVLERLLGSACYSPDLIERELGWRASISLKDGLSRMCLL